MVQPTLPLHGGEQVPCLDLLAAHAVNYFFCKFPGYAGVRFESILQREPCSWQTLGYDKSVFDIGASQKPWRLGFTLKGHSGIIHLYPAQ